MQNKLTLFDVTNDCLIGLSVYRITSEKRHTEEQKSYFIKKYKLKGDKRIHSLYRKIEVSVLTNAHVYVHVFI